MGNELATFDEWNETRSLAWDLKKFPIHDAFSRMFRDLNLVYKSHKAMYLEEYNPLRFKWLMVDNAAQSVFAFKREADGETMIFIFNMTPNYYDQYRIGVPYEGQYEEVFNTERDVYSGSGQYNGLPLTAEKIPAHGMPYSINMKLASYAGVFFAHIGETPLNDDEVEKRKSPEQKKAEQAKQEAIKKAASLPAKDS
jgi:1,4-alpha-glucan branching enzyme